MAEKKGRRILISLAVTVLIGSVTVFVMLKIMEYKDLTQYEELRTAVEEAAPT